MSEEVSEIINIVKNLPLKEILAYLVGIGVKKYTKKGYEKIKRIIQDRQNEGKYAFVPDKEEALKLKKMYENPGYKQIELLVPNYKYIDLIRTGLLIAEYHKVNTKKSNARTAEIKKQIGKRPNGLHLLKIVVLPTTPFFSVILEIIYDLKADGYSESQLEDQFDEMVSTWGKRTMCVQWRNKVEDVIGFCESRMVLKVEYIITLGMKSAAKIVEKALSKMEEDDFFKRFEYNYELIKKTEGNQPRVELRIFRK